MTEPSFVIHAYAAFGHVTQRVSTAVEHHQVNELVFIFSLTVTKAASILAELSRNSNIKAQSVYHTLRATNK